MRHPEGAFYCAEDADSEGEEGKFYVWGKDEVLTALGTSDSELFCEYHGVDQEGTFKGKSVLTARSRMAEFVAQKGMKTGEAARRLEHCRRKLLAVRDMRPRPNRDEKIMTDWNGLMISAFAYAASTLREPGYAASARGAARFVLSKLRRADGRLLKRWCDGDAGGLALLDDYAFFCNGLLDLYRATFEPEWLVEAKSLCMDMIRLFYDESGGGFFIGPSDGEALVVNPKPSYDGALTSGNSAAIMALARLTHHTGETALNELIERSVRVFSSDLNAVPSGFPSLLTALDYHHGPRREIVIAPGENDKEAMALVDEANKTFAPRTVALLHTNDASGRILESVAPFVKNLIARDKKTTLYACQNQTCIPPIADMEIAKKILKGG
jgi:hypothetical protein